MIKLLKTSFLLAGLFFGWSASAASFEGNVIGIFAIWGKVFVAVNEGGFDGAKSSCATTQDSIVYAFDPSSPSGKLFYANALAAKLTGRRVYVAGDNSCTASPYSGEQAEGMAGIDLKG